MPKEAAVRRVSATRYAHTQRCECTLRGACRDSLHALVMGGMQTVAPRGPTARCAGVAPDVGRGAGLAAETAVDQRHLLVRGV